MATHCHQHQSSHLPPSMCPNQQPSHTHATHATLHVPQSAAALSHTCHPPCSPVSSPLTHMPHLLAQAPPRVQPLMLRKRKPPPRHRPAAAVSPRPTEQCYSLLPWALLQPPSRHASCTGSTAVTSSMPAAHWHQRRGPPAPPQPLRPLRSLTSGRLHRKVVMRG